MQAAHEHSASSALVSSLSILARRIETVSASAASPTILLNCQHDSTVPTTNQSPVAGILRDEAEGSG